MNRTALPAAVSIAIALASLSVPVQAGPLPPLPDVAVVTNACAFSDGGGNCGGGVGVSSTGELTGVIDGSQTGALASVSGESLLKEVSSGIAPRGFVVTTAGQSVAIGRLLFASAAAGLDYWFRITAKAPFPLSLFGLAVPLTINVQHFASKGAEAIAWLMDQSGIPPASCCRIFDDIGITTDVSAPSTKLSLTVEADPNQVFQLFLSAFSVPDCTTAPPACSSSIAIIDPAIGFDQQLFDQEAAQRGVPSVQLDQFFQLDFSPGLDMLPTIPPDLGQELGIDLTQFGTVPGTGAVAEPSTLALLVVGLAALCGAHGVRRGRCRRLG